MNALKPVKLSPTHHQLLRDGAALTDVSGWKVAEHFGNPQEETEAVRSGVGLSDQSAVAKWEVKGTDVPRFLAAALAVQKLVPGRVARVGSGTVCLISRYHALYTSDDAQGEPPQSLEGQTASETCAHVTERTSGFGKFLLCGPQARDVLAKLTSLDLREQKLPNLSCASGPMASIQVLLIRRDRTGLPGYEILFNREYGEYFWNVIKEAGQEYHLRPFGLITDRSLES